MIMWNNTYMDFAEGIAKHSKATKEKVGCVVVKDGQVISTGYNGTPPGYSNICEEEVTLLEIDDGPDLKKLVTLPEVIHAEMNAIGKLAKSTVSSEGATLYVTKAPCWDCAKAIIAAGIGMVIFKGDRKKDKDRDSVSFLRLNDISVVIIDDKYKY